MVANTSPTYAQSGPNCLDSLSGSVQMPLPGGGLGPLPGASVYLRETGKGISTNSRGQFSLSALCPGIYTAEISYVGFSPVTQSINVPGPALSVVLTPDAETLREVVITEHRSEAQQLLQVQDQLTGRALDATRGQSLGESLKTITGLYSIQTGPTLSKPVIHGLYSNRIITLNNGIRQEDQQWGNEHAPQIDPFIARRITVIKGAASIRYGSDAIGGVILVEPTPMRAKPGIGGELNLVGVTNGRVGVLSGTLEGAFSKRLAGLSWRMQGTLKRGGYVRTPNYFLENTSHRESNFSADLHYEGRNWGVEVYYSQFTTKVGLFTGAQVGSLADLYAALDRTEPLRQPGFSYALGRPFQDLTHSLLKLRTHIEFSRGTLTATLARQENQRDEFDFISFSRIETPELSLRLVTTTADLIWEHSPKTSRQGGRWLGSLGLNGISQGNVRRFLFLIPNYKTYGLGLFAIERYARGRWVAEAGLRADYRWLRAFFLDEPTRRVFNTTRNWQALNGSLGLSCQVRSNLLLTGNLSTAWRVPNVADLYSNGLHQSAVAFERGNPNLVPEQALNSNLVVAYTRHKLKVEAGVYANRINQFIFLKPDSVPIVRQRGAFPAYSYTQVDALFTGLDLTLTYAFSERLSGTSKTSLLRANDLTNNQPLIFTPPNRTDNSLRYEWGNWGKLSGGYLEVGGLYVARQHRAPAVTRQEIDGQIIFTGDFAPPPPAYFLANAELGFTLPVRCQPMSFILSGTNLANVSYRDYLNRFRYFADEPGRTLSLKLRIPFQFSTKAE